MSRIKIAETKTGCDNLFLKINTDYSKAIEGDIAHCAAFVNEILGMGSDPMPPSPPPSPPPVPPQTWQTHYFSLILPSGFYLDVKPIDWSAGGVVYRDVYGRDDIKHPDAYPEYQWQATNGEFIS